MRKTIVILATLMVLTLSSWGFTAEGAEGFKIVVPQSFPDDPVPKGDVAKIFLKKKSSFPNGTKASPVELGKKSPVREAFCQAIHGRSASAIDKTWQRIIFSGKGNPPPELASDADVIAFVKSNPGGIGYVSEGASLDGVKELQVAN